MSKRIVISAAGTGGHVMPGIAVARLLVSRGWEVFWIGTEQGMERRLVERAGFRFFALDFQGLRGKGWKTCFSADSNCSQVSMTPGNC